MLRAAVGHLFKTAVFILLVGAGVTGVWLYERHHSAAWHVKQLEEQNRKLEKEKQELQTAVTRLSDEKRVAEVLVTDQKEDAGLLKTTLLFVEYARDGTSLPPKTFTIEGKSAHIDALVIKFDRGLVAANDALRGRSVALFRRIFGDYQSPETGYAIDEPGSIPDVYRGGPMPAEQEKFEKELWQNFWRLAEDGKLRAEKGVRVANGQGIWGPFNTDRLYTITLDADGGLNLNSEPLKGIYKEAIRQKMSRAE